MATAAKAAAIASFFIVTSSFNYYFIYGIWYTILHHTLYRALCLEFNGMALQPLGESQLAMKLMGVWNWNQG